MAISYLQIINEVLRDVNEVPLTASTFPTARGVQDFAKKSVNRAYMDIVNSTTEWPWLLNAATRGRVSVSTVVDQIYYTLPTPHNIDLESVTLTDPDDNRSYHLSYMSQEQWISKDGINEGSRRPEAIFKDPATGFYGLFPKPDKIYTLEWTQWDPATFFVADVDVLPFDDQWYTVILARATHYIWMWRENIEHASIANNSYKNALKAMKLALLTTNLDRIRAV